MCDCKVKPFYYTILTKFSLKVTLRASEEAVLSGDHTESADFRRSTLFFSLFKLKGV